MIDVKFDIEMSGVEIALDQFQAQRVRVGVLDRGKVARKAKSKKAGLAVLNGGSGQKRKINTSKSGRTNLKLTELAKFMDGKYGFISDAFYKSGSKELRILFDDFALMLTGKRVNSRHIENSAIFVIRNPILRMEYGRNARSTEQTKGFNRPLVDTGTLFSNIKAEYYMEQ